MRATFRTGPVGTGSFLLGADSSWSDPQDAEVWLLLLFFPLVPMSSWRVSATQLGQAAAQQDALRLTVHSKSRVSPLAVLRRVAKAVVVTTLTLLPLAFGIWKVGTPWATQVLTAVAGSFVAPGVLVKLGMAIEMGVVLGGAMLPILVLMHLDETTPRLPLRSAFGISQ